jgi:hypothetical protein
VTTTCLERYPATEVSDGAQHPFSWVCRSSDAVRLPGLVDHNPEPLVAPAARPEPGGVVVLRRFVVNALIFLAVAAVLLLLSPAALSYPITLPELAVLAAGLAGMMVSATRLRVSLQPQLHRRPAGPFRCSARSWADSAEGSQPRAPFVWGCVEAQLPNPCNRWGSVVRTGGAAKGNGQPGGRRAHPEQSFSSSRRRPVRMAPPSRSVE